jgi:hypothetical protein
MRLRPSHARGCDPRRARNASGGAAFGVPRWHYSAMASPAALLVVPDGRGTTAWQHIIRALGRQRPRGRVYVLFQVHRRR